MLQVNNKQKHLKFDNMEPPTRVEYDTQRQPRGNLNIEYFELHMALY